MSDEIEKKLLLLKEEYIKNLPGKLNEITNLWFSIAKQWDTETFITFHRKVHSLTGSAGIYGFLSLSKATRSLEMYLKKMLDQTSLLPGQAEHILKMLEDMQVHAGQPIISKETSSKNLDPTKAGHKKIFFFDQESEWSSHVISQAKSFGYDIEIVDNERSLFEAVDQNPLALLINMDLVTEELQNKLKKVKGPVIFCLSSNSGFDARLKAVRINSQAFFVKPFRAEELINHFDRILKADQEEYRVLIIDDEKEVAEYHAALLENANMKTHVITNATEADIALQEFRPDILLIDLYMPECSGIELAAIIRQQAAYESIPIIFLSSEQDKLTQLNAMKLGADDFVTKSTQPQHLILAIRNRAARYKILRSMMIKDNLTGVFNHSFIMYQVEIGLKEAKRANSNLSIVMIDLDKFKHVNDTYGHMAGDHVLRSLCLVLLKRLRGADVVGRYGGEEFLIILHETDINSAKKLMDEIRKQFHSLTFSWNDQLFNTSFSAGIASFPNFMNAKALVKAADEALYKAKNAGRNKIEVSVAENLK